MFIWERVLINKNGGNGWQFFLMIDTAPLPAISLHRVTLKFQITSSKNCLSTLKFFQVSFFMLLLCVSTKNRTKLKKIFNLSHRPKWNTSSTIYKLHLIFSLTLALRDQSKWRANINEHGEVYNTHPNFCSESNK